ncbi:MAG: RraA family protein [bacterium]|nr:RraA family protein [bacterium]
MTAPSQTAGSDSKQASRARLTHSELLQLKRWNTPTIYNGWEQITRLDAAAPVTNLEETRDFMPQMGPMIGYAVTLIIEPSKRGHKLNNASAWQDYRQYIAAQPGPKIVVVQDLDKPAVIGSFWGEVNANVHRTLGCVGTIVDGAVRDVDEMTNAGFKSLARRMCVGHAHSIPVQWGCEVSVFGTRVVPGQLIHADKHGFIAVPHEDEEQLLRAAVQMDINECETVIAAARSCHGLSMQDSVQRINQASAEFGNKTRTLFGRSGEH